VNFSPSMLGATPLRLSSQCCAGATDIYIISLMPLHFWLISSNKDELASIAQAIAKMPLSPSYNEIRQALWGMERAVGPLTALHVADKVANLIQSLDTLSEGRAEIMTSQLKSEAEILASIKSNPTKLLSERSCLI